MGKIPGIDEEKAYTMNKFLFYMKDIFVDQPRDGFKEIINNTRAFFRKPSNAVVLMIFSNIFLIMIGLIGAFTGWKVPIWLYIGYIFLLILFFIWKNMVGGQTEYKWKQYINKEVKEAEKQNQPEENRKI